MLQNLTQFLSQAPEELKNSRTTVTSHSNHARLCSYHKATFSTPTISMGKNPYQYLRERELTNDVCIGKHNTHITHTAQATTLCILCIVHTVLSLKLADMFPVILKCDL